MPTGGIGSSTAATPSTAASGVSHYYVSQTIGCESSRTDIVVTVNALPTVSINSIASFINYYASPLALTGNPNGGIFSGDGIAGNNLNPNMAGLGTTYIIYNLTDGNSCSNSTTVSAIIYDTTGVICTTYDTVTTLIAVTDTLIIDAVLTGMTPPNNENIIKVYPNPAKTHIYIDNGNYALMNGYKVVIENTLGQQVFFSLINQQQFYIDLSTWTGSGIYFVQLIDPQNNTIENRKIVIQ